MNPSTLVRIPTVGLLIALCAGCTVEDNARRIIEYNTEGGEVALVAEDGALLALGRMADGRQAVHPRKVFVGG